MMTREEASYLYTPEPPCCDHCGWGHDTADCTFPVPRKEGHALVGEACGYAWAVFSRADVEAWLGEDEPVAIAERLAERLTGWREYYGGPGRGFRDEPVARVYRRNILVTQRTGLDI